MAVTRAQIKANLLRQLEEKELTDPVYLAIVEQYMTFFAMLKALNREMKYTDDDGVRRVNEKKVREARQVEKSMRDILDFLGLKPPEKGGGPVGIPPL